MYVNDHGSADMCTKWMQKNNLHYLFCKNCTILKLAAVTTCHPPECSGWIIGVVLGDF